MYKRILFAAALLFLSVCSPQSGMAQLQISPDQKMMFEAVKQVMNQDYKGADATYTRIIAINNGNMDAYLQRGIVRRELGDAAGTQADGQAVVTLANNQLQASPNNPNLYYQRGMGYRLLKNYDQAKTDIKKAMDMSGKTSWQTDLQAIDLEQKEAK